MSDRESPLEVIHRDDGQWAIVDRDGRLLSAHPNQAGAEAERARLAQAGERAGQEADHAEHGELAAQDDPYTDNVGS